MFLPLNTAIKYMTSRVPVRSIWTQFRPWSLILTTTLATGMGGSAAALDSGPPATTGSSSPGAIAQGVTYPRRPFTERDQVVPGSAFAQFLDRTRQAVRDRDAAYLRAIAAPSLLQGSEETASLSEFNIDNPNAPFWLHLERVLAIGCAFTSDISYEGPGVTRSNAETAICPFTAEIDGANLTDEEYYAQVFIVGENVRARLQSNTESPVVGTVSNEVVRFAYNRAENWNSAAWEQMETLGGWVPVTLPGGTQGFVSSRYAFVPLGYRAYFTNAYGDWKMTLLTIGD